MRSQRKKNLESLPISSSQVPIVPKKTELTKLYKNHSGNYNKKKM